MGRYDRIVSNDSACVPHLEFMELSDNLIKTRGNKFKIVQHHCHYDLRKYNFTNRVILIWNSLPNFVVSAGTINTFKNRLDKFWSDQDILYDYRADLHGIGNCSEHYILAISCIINSYDRQLFLRYRGRRRLHLMSQCDVMM